MINHICSFRIDIQKYENFSLFQMISCAWCDVKQFDKILIEPSN